MINCRECNAPISSEAPSCPHCGAPALKQSQEPAPAPSCGPCRTPELPPKTWLLESILATIFCCLPLGVVGIIYASKIESAWYAGNRELALSSARSAKSWTIAAFWVGLGSCLLYIIFYVIIIAFGLTSVMSNSLLNM